MAENGKKTEVRQLEDLPGGDVVELTTQKAETVRGGAVDGFMYFADVKGESSDDKHKGEIHL